MARRKFGSDGVPVAGGSRPAREVVVEFEVDEALDADDGFDGFVPGGAGRRDEPGEERSRDERAGRGRRRPGRLGVLTVGVLAVAAAASALWTGIASRHGGLADQPGGLHRLDGPVEQRWVVPVGRRADIIAADGAVAVLDHGLTAYDAVSGEVRWRVAGLSGANSCLPRPNEPVQRMIVCRAPVPGRPNGVRITVVDTHSGAVVGTRELTALGRDVEFVGADRLVRVLRAGAGLIVRCEDVVDGSIRWQKYLEPHRGRHVSFPYALGSLSVNEAAGLVTVVGHGTAATFTAGGRRIGADDLWVIGRLPADRYVGSGYGRGEGVVFDEQARALFDFVGRGLTPALADESVAGVVPVNLYGAVGGLDALTGAILWRSEGEVDRAVARVRGVLVVQSGARLRAIDLMDGDERWTASLPDTAVSTPMSDGEVLVLATSGTPDGRDLVAVSLADGRAVWQRAIGPGVERVVAVDGRLFAVSDTALTALS